MTNTLPLSQILRKVDSKVSFNYNTQQAVRFMHVIIVAAGIIALR